MKQTQRLLLMLAAVALMAACGPKEGAPTKNVKLVQVSTSEKMLCDGQTYYARDTYTSEIWHWDGNKVYRIDHIGEATYSENFYFDRRHRIIRNTVPAFHEHNEFAYDGRKLDHIDCYRDSVLYQTLTFLHDGKTLTGLIVNTHGSNTQTKASESLLTSLLGDEIGLAVTECTPCATTGGAKSTTTRYQFTWENQDITSVRYNDGGQEIVITLTYDDKLNPRKELYGQHELEDPMFGFAMISKHNILTLRKPYRQDDHQLFSYSYEYTDKYPSSRTLRYSYSEINGTTFEMSLFEVENREDYVYQNN